MSNRKIEIFEEQLKAIAENFLNDIQRFSTTAPAPIVIEEPPIEPTAAMPEQPIQGPAIDAVAANVVPVEPPPRFRVFWNAWKDGNASNGESESTLETAQMAKLLRNRYNIFAMDDTNLNTLKYVVDKITSGEPLEQAKVDASYVNYNNALLKKIDILKKITLLNKDTMSYLYSIKLTDKVKDVEPKVNAIFQLAKSAGFLDEYKEKEEEKNKKVVVPGDSTQTAINIVNKIIAGEE